MTSSKMENPLWKLMQNDPNSIVDLVRNSNNNLVNLNNYFNQQLLQQLTGVNGGNVNNQQSISPLSSSSNSSSSSTLIDTNNQFNQQISMSGPGLNQEAWLNKVNRAPAAQRELGVIEKVVNNSYGFIRSLNQSVSSNDASRLFFHYNSYMTPDNILKNGDVVEYDEAVDKRNGKLMAINITKFQNPQQSQPALNLNKLEEFLSSTEQGSVFPQNQVNPQQLLGQNDLSSSSLRSAINDNPLLGLLNKENIFNDQQANFMTNFNMMLNLNKQPELTTEVTEGQVLVCATKRTNMPGIDGRIAYQRSGETFYISYSCNDVAPNFANFIKPGDRVKFLVTFVNGLQVPMGARQVELIPDIKKSYRGIVSTLKDGFGKIEREDGLKETFFVFSDYKGGSAVKELRLGLNVEFEVENRLGKEMASNIRSLPDGTVSFEDVSGQVYVGRILHISSNGNGRLIYDSLKDGCLVELNFSDKDRIQALTYTLLIGDFVQFRIATDKLKRVPPRATQLTLIEDHSLVSNSVNTNEIRELGVVVKIDDRSGLIRCLNRDDLVTFGVGEVISFVRYNLNPVNNLVVEEFLNKIKLEVGDSVEFSVAIKKLGLEAIRIKRLEKGTVKFEHISDEILKGSIEKVGSSEGVIRCDGGLIKFLIRDNEPLCGVGDKVQFNLSKSLKSGTETAVNLKVLEQFKEKGFVTVLKDNYGFIEFDINSTDSEGSAKQRDIFFHYSSLKSEEPLVVGDEVEFVINRKVLTKLAAENVVKLASKTIKNNFNVGDQVLKGRVVQQLRSHSSTPSTPNQDATQDQIDDNYYGKIQILNDRKDNNENIYYYGLFSLSDKKSTPQNGDLVTFQLINDLGKKYAHNIQLVKQNDSSASSSSTSAQQSTSSSSSRVRDFKKGRIESIKHNSGYIEYPTNDNNTKKIFFHISDLAENTPSESPALKVGDEVEFVISHVGSRNGKAIKIRKIVSASSSPESSEPIEPVKRPERLITKLKVANIDESGKQLILIRQPFNPDGKQKSFARDLIERQPGSLPDVNNRD